MNNEKYDAGNMMTNMIVTMMRMNGDDDEDDRCCFKLTQRLDRQLNRRASAEADPSTTLYNPNFNVCYKRIRELLDTTGRAVPTLGRSRSSFYFHINIRSLRNALEVLFP